MLLLSDITCFNAAAILIALCLAAITFFKWRYNHWTSLGIPTVPPTIPFGNIKQMFFQTTSLGEVMQDIYNYGKSRGHKHVGAYFLAKPMYVPIDVDIIKHILQKDFAHFMDRSTYVNERDDPLTAHLFSLRGDKWKVLRQKFSPTFTSGQLKSMFQTLVDCGKNLEEFLETNKGALDIKDVLARYTTDIIGSCAFGIECNTMKNPDADFRKYGKLFFEQGFWTGLKALAFTSLPANLLNFLRIRAIRSDVSGFFMKVVQDIVHYRENNDVRRKDFMDLLLQLRNTGKISENGEITGTIKKGKLESLTMNELAAQAFVFYLAGFETSSTTMTFALFELTQNQEVQDKLREEINTVLAKHKGAVSYEAVMEMPYLQNVIDESLRKYPPVPVLNRICTKDYKIPKFDIVLKKGTDVMISALGIQRDPEYYPNPDVFDPDRFTPEVKNTRPSCTHLPFGEGPRNCIGLRFGLLQTKVGLITLLKNHKVTLSPKTPLPLNLDPTSFIMTSKCDVWLNVTKLE